MRYAAIEKFDVNNGLGIGVSLFVQGCPKDLHCVGCHNSAIWNFDGGKEWTDETQLSFLDLIDNPYITRTTILGGEPLCEENIAGVDKLIDAIRERFPEKKIWLYTGYYAEDFNPQQELTAFKVDYLVDGPFVEAEKDLTLAFRGSKNQTIYDMKASIYGKEVSVYQIAKEFT